jgi:flagellar biosynthetic protein FliP
VRRPVELLVLALCLLGALWLAPQALAAPPEPVKPPGVQAPDVRPPTVQTPSERPGGSSRNDSSVAVRISSDAPALSRTVLIVLLLTIGAVAPAILLLMTSFTRYVVVLSLARNGLGLQGIPPNQVLIGLALFMTFFTMGPVFSQVNEAALQPALEGRISASTAIERGFAPLRTFMLQHTEPEDLRMFLDASGARPEDPSEVSASALVPAFVISELRRAFMIGFLVFLPFLVIDLVVSSVLMSLGMVMVPPVVISLPLKLLLFVLVDGWGLLVSSLVTSVTRG